MRELTVKELEFVSGGRVNVSAPSLSKPTRGESELGKQINDIAGMLDALGSWIGISIFDWTH